MTLQSLLLRFELRKFATNFAMKFRNSEVRNATSKNLAKVL